MLTSIRLSGFRTFRSLRVEGLNRVNLFVGANNTGKTSALEALEILLGDFLSVWRIPERRGEIFIPQLNERVGAVDVSHLFRGHKLQAGARFEIEGRGSPARVVSCEVVSAFEIDLSRMKPPIVPTQDGEPVLAILIQRTPGGTSSPIPVSSAGGMERFLLQEKEGALPLRLIGSGDQNTVLLSGLWDRIVLTPEEPRVISALQIIEPDIERIAAVSHVNRGGPAGMLVKLAGLDGPVPLASLGDGLKRLMLIALNMVISAGGFLLVDEIETGLHHSIMERMWRLVIEGARRLGVQVFATTHSLDCLTSLATLSESAPELGAEIAVHRLERDHESSTLFTAKDLTVAARHDMELR